jgi:hypothetical protein
VKPAILAMMLALAPAQPASKPEVKPATPAKATTSAPVPAKAPSTVVEFEVAAIEQELARGVSQLRLPDSPAPYLATVQLVRASLFGLDGSYGGVITDLVEEQAAAAVEVRVGDAKRDQGGMFGADGPQLRFIVSLEPSSALTRHKLWLALDQAFRAATATYSQKQAILARLAGDPPPPDMGPKPDPVPRQPVATPSNAGFDREGAARAGEVAERAVRGSSQRRQRGRADPGATHAPDDGHVGGGWCCTSSATGRCWWWWRTCGRPTGCTSTRARRSTCRRCRARMMICASAGSSWSTGCSASSRSRRRRR